jgi:hypothetical protein
MNVSHTFATIYPVQFNSLMHVCACIKGDQCVRVALITWFLIVLWISILFGPHLRWNPAVWIAMAPFMFGRVTEEQSGDAERYNKRITTPVGWLSPPATTRRPDLLRIGITWTSSLRNERG